jgi:hypothetical protein
MSILVELPRPFAYGVPQLLGPFEEVEIMASVVGADGAALARLRADGMWDTAGGMYTEDVVMRSVDGGDLELTFTDDLLAPAAVRTIFHGKVLRINREGLRFDGAADFAAQRTSSDATLGLGIIKSQQSVHWFSTIPEARSYDRAVVVTSI